MDWPHKIISIIKVGNIDFRYEPEQACLGRPFPSKDDVAVELILRECGRDHDFPQTRLEAGETETDGYGRTVNVNRWRAADVER